MYQKRALSDRKTTARGWPSKAIGYIIPAFVRKDLLLIVIIGAATAGCRPQPARDVSAVDLASRATAELSRQGAIDLAHRATTDVVLAADTTVVSAKVAAGATLDSILRAQHVVAADVTELILRAGAVFDLRRVRRDQPYRIEVTPQNTVRKLEYEIDGDRYLRVERSSPADDLVADVLPIPKTRKTDIVRGGIDREHPSLVSAMDAIGESIDLTLALAEIFGGEIDFSTGLQRGDVFQLTVDKQYRDDGRFGGYGPILAAEFQNAGRAVRAVRYTPEGGSPGYYDEKGVSMKRFFLASPLKFQPVVTSGFSASRFHPVLREYRAHLGVDYRAPAGSPVVAVADGVVVSAGMAGGSGRMVHLRHANAFETEYLHLSTIAVHAGERVHQGDLIGRVGATGLATGPHLDYRLKRNGVFVNPVTAHRAMPPPDPVPAAQMPAFIAARDRALAALPAPSDARVANRDAGVK
jgi:murein DD-endopeptidase MepM/ murein hydrolase activator NlpD